MIQNNNLPADWYVLVNPCSGKKTYRRWLKSLQTALYECEQTNELHFTEWAGHAVELTRQAVNQGYKQFVILGGDGTLNEVINGIFTSDCTSSEEIVLAVIPSGTGNDWVRQSNITRKTNLTDYFRFGKRIETDVGVITEKETPEKRRHYFLNAAGLGFDGDVVYRTNLLRKRVGAHSWTYLAAVFRSVFSLRYARLSIETEQEQIKGDVLTLCIGNGCYTGGGLMQTPRANPTDGMFDIMLIQRIRLRNIPSLLNALLKRRIDTHPSVRTIRSNCITISALQPVRCETDGILLDMNFPLEIKVLHHKIRFLVPEKFNC
ncbi:MAG: diacylglycerol kinase family lipid kinase [Tannerella sp.]|jgi:diacylglycerol kinase (ATP)|nr:diacylglycerol kinase family lipid kinase [Tannerella sp.]